MAIPVFSLPLPPKKILFMFEMGSTDLRLLCLVGRHVDSVDSWASCWWGRIIPWCLKAAGWESLSWSWSYSVSLGHFYVTFLRKRWMVVGRSCRSCTNACGGGKGSGRGRKKEKWRNRETEKPEVFIPLSLVLNSLSSLLRWWLN